MYALPVGILLSVPYIFLNNSYLHFIRSFTCFQSWLLYQAEPAFDELPSPDVDWVDMKIECYIRGGAAGAQGDHSFYQWVDGVLTEVRHIKLDFEDREDYKSHYVSVTDLIDGEMQEVFRYKGDYYFDIVERWRSLGYAGEN